MRIREPSPCPSHAAASTSEPLERRCILTSDARLAHATLLAVPGGVSFSCTVRAAQRAPPERTPSVTPPSSAGRRGGQQAYGAARPQLPDLDLLHDDEPLILVESDEEEQQQRQEQEREDMRDGTESQADGGPRDRPAARVRTLVMNFSGLSCV